MIYALLEKHYENSYSSESLDSIDFNFNKSLSGTGWYPREFTNEKIAYRWTGLHKDCTLDLPIIRGSNLKIELTVTNYISHDTLASLRLEINNTPISLEKKFLNGKIIFEGIMPNSALDRKKNFMRLFLKIDQTRSPNSIDPSSNDFRNLGIAFERIKVKPLK